MAILESLKSIDDIANKYNIDTPYLVGGVPRDYAMNLDMIKTVDVDITTNTSDSLRLGILTSDRLNKSFNIFEDKHITVYFDDYSIDFSSNFKSHNVVNFLKSEKCTKFICPAYPNIDKKLFEVYSRDFTINTLHQDIGTREITDLTGMGIDDLANKVIKTPVPPEITISDDPRRIFRAIYFAAKYNFKIDNEIIEYVLENNDLLYDDKIKDKFVSSKINSSLAFDSAITIDYLINMNILSRVPLVGIFKDYIIKNKLIIKYLDGLKDGS